MTLRVSSSGRCCGRPRSRRSEGVLVRAMLLNDACHSIDTRKINPSLENIKFPKYPAQAVGRTEAPGTTAMNSHSPSFPAIDGPISGDAARSLQPVSEKMADDATTAPAAARLNPRRLLMTGAALAVVAGAAWYGWNY